MKIIQPLVSIICPTYNHEKYIAQTLEGFVMQETAFPFEIIIHDDASTDNTAMIVRQFEVKYPDLFFNIYQIENQLSKSIDSVTKITFAAARGKYIALCEGDDYWTDSYKLQKQVDFLELNPDFSLTHTNVRIFNQEINEFINVPPISKASNFNELFSQKKIRINTCTMCFRNHLIVFPKWMNELRFGDHVILALLALKGKIMPMDDVTAVYRKSYSSLTSITSVFIWIIDNIRFYKYLKMDADKKFHKSINVHIANGYFSLFRYFISRKKYSIKYSTRFLIKSFSYQFTLKRLLHGFIEYSKAIIKRYTPYGSSNKSISD